MIFSKKDHVLDIPQHANGHSSPVPQFWAIFNNLRAQTQFWLGPTPFILGTIQFLHHHLQASKNYPLFDASDDGRTERSEASSLGVSVYHGIPV